MSAREAFERAMGELQAAYEQLTNDRPEEVDRLLVDAGVYLLTPQIRRATRLLRETSSLVMERG